MSSSFINLLKYFRVSNEIIAKGAVPKGSMSF